MSKVKSLFSIGILCAFLFVFQVGAAFAATQNYTVKSGDNLYVIAKRFHVTVAAIKSATGLKSEKLSIGQVLKIPVAGTTASKTTATTSTGQTQKYVVKSGDSLYLISKRFGVSVAAIKQASKLTSESLHIGQVLYIPVKGSTTPVQTATPKPTPTPSRGEQGGIPVGAALDWWTIVDKMFPNGMTVKVVDVDTGLSFYIKRSFGHNHADVEPPTVQDTQTMKRIWGGNWSWARRAVVVNIAGRWVAASLNGMPHGQELIGPNGMDGQVCMHFLNSKTHGSNRVDPEHQAAIRKAAGLR